MKFVLLLATFVTSGMPASDDSATLAAELNSAKSTHEENISKAQDALLRQLDRTLESARQRGDLKKVESLTKQRDAFVDMGTLPTAIRTATFERGVKLSRRKLQQSYEEAVRGYTKANLIDEARSVQTELERFLASDPYANPARLMNAELLRNPNCETESTPGEYSAWTINSGNWNPESRDSTVAGTRPVNGRSFFFPGNCRVGEIAQSVSVRPLALIVDEGQLTCTASVFVQSLAQRPSDTAEFVLEFIDESDATLKRLTTEKVASINKWQQVGHIHAIPKGTRSIVVRLIAHRTGPRGSKVNNAYFDQASLKVTRTKQ